MYIIILTRKSIGNNDDDNASRIFNTRYAAKPWEHKKIFNPRRIKINLSFNTRIKQRIIRKLIKLPLSYILDVRVLMKIV